MPRYLNTLREQRLTVAICDRCRMKRKIAELVSDVNSPGLRVCKKTCADQQDPYRLPMRAAEKLQVSHPRPDEPLVPQ